MTNMSNSLSHSEWLGKYHFVFSPKYRRKIINGQYRDSKNRDNSVVVQLQRSRDYRGAYSSYELTGILRDNNIWISDQISF